MGAMEVIRTEARAHRTVLIDGCELDGTRETREVEPYSLRSGKHGMRLMFWCLKHGGTRGLLVDNIVGAEPTGNSFAPRWPVEL